MTTPKTLAVILQGARLTAGLSQGRLSMASGVPLATITRIEQGITVDPKGATLAALAGALGVTVGQLLGVEPMTAGLTDAGGTVRARE